MTGGAIVVEFPHEISFFGCPQILMVNHDVVIRIES
jgi:hypothetical protein